MHVRDGLTGSDAIALFHQDAVGFESPSYRSGRARDRVGERGLLLARQVENGLNVPAVDDEGVAFHSAERGRGKKDARQRVVGDHRRWPVPGISSGEVLAE